MLRRRPAVIANEIRLKRSQFAGAFMIVEGRDDRLFFEKFVNSATCKLVVAENKKNAKGVVRILNDDRFEGAICIVDADFDRILGEHIAYPNVALTDFHDLECILLSSPALEAVLGEFASRDKLGAFGRDVRQSLIEAAAPIGCFRLLSIQRNLALRFEGLNYARCIDRNALEIDRIQLVREVKNRSNRQDLSDDVLLRGIAEVEEREHDVWQVCEGTDLIGVLSLGLRHALGNNNARDVQDEKLRQALRLAFSEESFAQTTVKDQMTQWETANPKFKILP